MLAMTSVFCALLTERSAVEWAPCPDPEVDCVLVTIGIVLVVATWAADRARKW